MKNILTHVILVIFLCCIVFSYNVHHLFLPYDGSYMKERIKNSAEWSRFTVNASLNPLQGLGDLAFSENFRLSPACLVNHYFYKRDVSPILVYTIITLELFLAICWFGSCIRLDRFSVLLAAWLAIIFIMPFIRPAYPGGFFNLYSISTIVPNIMEEMALILFIAGFVTKIDLNRFLSATGYGLLTSILIIYLISWHPITCILALPFIILFSLHHLAIQCFKSKEYWRAASTLAVVYLPLIFPFIYITGWLMDSPAAFFPGDFAPPDSPALTAVSNISILFSGPCKYGWIGTLIFFTGFCGAFLAIKKKDGALKNTAILYSLYSLGILMSGFLFTFILTKYRVPISLYYEWFIWPLMFLYSALFFRKMGEGLCGRLSLFVSKMAPDVMSNYIKQKKHISSLIAGLRLPPDVVFISGCGVGLLLCIYSGYIFQCNAAKPVRNPYPPVLSGFNAELVRRVGLNSQSNWKGCVATITENKQPDKMDSGTSWVDQSTWDFNIWSASGSDYRGVCLWWLNIPTLFVYNAVRSPEYHFMMTRLFATRKDEQQRNVLVLTRPDVKLLGLFGTKILITDKPIAPDAHYPVIPVPGAPENIYAYELTRTNVSGFSPLKISRSSSAQDTLSRITGADFDPFNEAVVYEDIPPNLTTANQHEMAWKKNGVHVKAHADGMCLLVLPLQYSHCIKLKAKSGDVSARIIRVDMTLTGILFFRDLDVVISPNYGPFTNVFGKFNDYFDLKRLVRDY